MSYVKFYNNTLKTLLGNEHIYIDNDIMFKVY